MSMIDHSKNLRRRVVLWLGGLGTILLFGAIVADEMYCNWIDEGVGGTVNSTSSSWTSSSSKILPETLTFMRHNVQPPPELQQPSRRYGLPPNFNDTNCSCWNPHSTFECCERYLHQAHKMGIAMTRQIFFKSYEPSQQLEGQIKRSNYGLNHRRNYDMTKFSLFTRGIDYRDVIVLRNIYSALVSGYLYHKNGFECWLTASGQPKLNERTVGYTKKHWDQKVKYPIVPRNTNNGHHRTICEYMSNETEVDGMRAYIGWVFAVKWEGILSRYALSQQTKSTRDRTMVVCYEDFISPNHYNLKTIDAVLDFFYNGTSHKPWTGRPTTSQDDDGGGSGGGVYDGPHSTSHDPVLREHLKGVIKELDEEFFNGDIAWLDSILPC